MRHELIFAVDVDEVLRSTLHNMVELYNREFNQNLKTEEVKDFVVEVSFPEVEKNGFDTGEWFFQQHSEEIFVTAKPIDGVVSAVRELRTYGKVIIVTYQKSFKNKIDTLKWLDKYGIEYDGICFVKDKTKIICDFLIDDNDWNFINSGAKHGILITAPYNKKKRLKDILNKSNCEDITRYKSIVDFVKDISKGNLRKNT